MGADQSDANEMKTQQQYQMFLLQYSKERDSDHNQFGLVKLYNHNQNNSMICIKKFQTKSDTELTQITNHLRKRKIFVHPNLVQLLAVRTSNEQSICSDSSLVMVVSEFFPDTLQSELKKRRQPLKRYPESHIWLLIQQIVDPLAFLEDQKQVHGDIQPQNIYLDETGSVKLAEYNYFPGGQYGFQKMLLSKDRAYLSPILLNNYRNMNFKAQHNEYKSDVFSFGMTLLEVLLLEESYDCMDFQNGCIIQNVIDSKLQKVKISNYSQLLTNFVRELIQIEEKLRPSWNDLKQVIDQFRDKICNLIPFYQEKRQMSPTKLVYQSTYIPQQHILSSPQSKILSSPRQPQMLYQTYLQPQPLYQTKQMQPIPMQQSIYYESGQKQVPIKKITKLEDTVSKQVQQPENNSEKTTLKQSETK
ncbi:unnamed protein product [Paramecium pentaurelia]|uniref:Protein kinase domain-containing protein n=1 Tax=Paramecium pentaurelia TaxID=43138 RepID=A0A8S1X1H3_9CILI|nr:unnamed protein product [Paramecium pentaurelia]